MFTMQYECPCGTAWEMTHDSHCDDRCPACDLANSPTDVQDMKLHDECYTLVAENMWVSVKKFEIRIHTTDEGVVIDVYRTSDIGAVEDPITSTYAFDNECERAEE